MNSRDYFPLGKAYGKAFCNRIDEVKKLAGNIESGKHTFIVAPRRYGKSSLCERALGLISFPCSKLDFYLAVTEKDAERILINGISELVGKSIGSAEKLAHIVKKYAKKLKPKFSVGNTVFHLEFELSDKNSPAENISEGLMILEKLLKERNKQAILLLDEFQEIGVLEGGKGIEGAIRHAAQETQNLVFIFSGSNSHLLRNMFEDERRPLYKLCRKLVLERIDSLNYKKHLNEAADAMWKQPLSNEVFDSIMQYSECHPYYVNYLCDEIWSVNNRLPKLPEVKKAWDEIVEEERSDLLKDFFSLSENQRKLMIYIANYNGKNIYSHEAAKKMDMPVSSVSRVLEALIEKDYIEKSMDEYRLIVPVYKTLLEKRN